MEKRSVKTDIRYIKEDLQNIQKCADILQDCPDKELRQKARGQIIEWCHELMGDCCNLYEEIENKFGIDVYND